MIIKALIMAGYTNIQAISSAMDSGGKTGIIRTDERDRVIAISDLLRSLLSLIPPAQINSPQIQAFTDLVNFTDGRGRNLGYTLYYALLEKYHGQFSQVQTHLEKLLNFRFIGTAIPVTLHSANLCFDTQAGSQHKGEHELDRLRMSTDPVTNFYIDHPVPSTRQARQALEQANFIIFCPGSIYGSILANFLATGMNNSLKASTAQKILITNLVSDRNQTHQIDLPAYINLFKKYSALKKPVDTLIIPHLTQKQFDLRFSRSARNYASEHSYFLGWTPSQQAQIRQSGISVRSSDIFTVTSRFRIRHDPQKLAPILKSLIG